MPVLFFCLIVCFSFKAFCILLEDPNQFFSEEQLKSKIIKPGKSLSVKYDFVVAGAGFSGATAARLLAEAGHQVLVVEKRPHLGGNAHDYYDEHGVLVHLYGPHIFHTNNKEVFEFLSRFTGWHFYEHRVKSLVEGKLYPIPINRATLNQLYGLNLSTEKECEDFFKRVREPKEKILNGEDVVLSQVGRDLCDKFFRGYTAKQWGGLDLKDLAPEVLRRIPTRTNEDNRYFSDTYQGIPNLGYTEMFKKMLDHPNITTFVGVNYLYLQDIYWAHKLIFTGPIDSFFEYKFGPLPYQSLRFEWEHLAADQFQEVGTVNYPSPEVAFTRVTEFKHLTGQTVKGTTILREFPTQARAQEGQEPFYPILSVDNNGVLENYKKLASLRPDVVFTGRLAQYKYYNMDEAVVAAMETVKTLLAELSS